MIKNTVQNGELEPIYAEEPDIILFRIRAQYNQLNKN